jgi:cytochrome c biogenesis protein
MGLKAIWSKIYSMLASVKTGITLIIVVGISSAIGTVILQRPTTEADEIARAYSPETLAWLDRVGLTDIYHSWWFLTLLCLFCVCLIFVSLDRWPNAWKMYSRPVRYATPSFRLSLPQKATFPVRDAETGLSTAERVLGRFGLKPERVKESGDTGLFAQRQRFSVFAVYVVHLSLLSIFAGYIVDGIVGYRGNMSIPEGTSLNQILVSDNHGGQTVKTIPFSLRCDAAGEETYPDGSPKKWWSTLTVVEGGKEVLSKTIVVNDPLVYKGLHIYQSNMGQSGTPRTLTFTATPTAAPGAPESVPQNVEVPLTGQAKLPDGESLSILRWVPDYYVQDKEVFKKSDSPDNPAVQLALTNDKGETKKLWILYDKMNSTQGQDAPYVFSIKSATWSKYTGLEVSHHPGQLGIWIGVVLMAIGLVVAFYAQHLRIWAAIAEDGKGGKVLWVGATANKNRDRLKIRFDQIAEALRQELGTAAPAAPDSKSNPKTLSPV